MYDVLPLIHVTMRHKLEHTIFTKQYLSYILWAFSHTHWNQVITISVYTTPRL